MKRSIEDTPIVFIGAGNLATNLAKALYHKGFRIVQVYSRTMESARTLAEKVEAEYTTALITAKAIVTKVQNYVKLSDEEIDTILADNQSQLNLSEKQKKRWHKKCLCLVSFAHVEAIAPLAFDHQGNMDDWLIIDKIEDVVVGTSIPYNYEKSKLAK